MYIEGEDRGPYLLVFLPRVKLVRLHHLAGAIHELDGSGKVGAWVHNSGGRDHKSSVIVLNLVLEEGRYSDMDILEEV